MKSATTDNRECWAGAKMTLNWPMDYPNQRQRARARAAVGEWLREQGIEGLGPAELAALPMPPWLSVDASGALLGHPSDIPLPALQGDNLSPLFQRLRLTSWTLGVSELRGDAAILLPPVPDGYVVVLDGELHMQVGDKDPVILRQGDYVIHGPAAGMTLATGPDAVPTPVAQPRGMLMRPPQGPGLGEGPIRCRFIGGFIMTSQAEGGSIRWAMPPVMLVRTGQQAPESTARHALRMIESEVSAQRPGSHAVLDNLVQILTIEALRSVMEGAADGQSAGLATLLDSHVGPVIALMHAMLARPWSLEDMAKEAGLSRAAFAARFTAMLGVPPASYLRNLRMTAASEMLRTTADPLDSISRRVGYSSLSSFCSAFLRWAGKTPTEYRRHASGAPGRAGPA